MVVGLSQCFFYLSARATLLKTIVIKQIKQKEENRVSYSNMFSCFKVLHFCIGFIYRDLPRSELYIVNVYLWRLQIHTGEIYRFLYYFNIYAFPSLCLLSWYTWYFKAHKLVRFVLFFLVFSLLIEYWVAIEWWSS